jgi:hypothetical protein
LARRISEGAGVEFITADVQKPTEARLREIEIENAQPKERILGLSQKLAGLEQKSPGSAPRSRPEPEQDPD